MHTQRQIMRDSTKRLMRYLKTGRRLYYVDGVYDFVTVNDNDTLSYIKGDEVLPQPLVQSAYERWAIR